jgi:hypothetical protein
MGKLMKMLPEFWRTARAHLQTTNLGSRFDEKNNEKDNVDPLLRCVG